MRRANRGSRESYFVEETMTEKLRDNTELVGLVVQFTMERFVDILARALTVDQTEPFTANEGDRHPDEQTVRRHTYRLSPEHRGHS